MKSPVFKSSFYVLPNILCEVWCLPDVDVGDGELLELQLVGGEATHPSLIRVLIYKKNMVNFSWLEERRPIPRSSG